MSSLTQQASTTVFTPIDGNSSYKLVFDDEFNGSSIDNRWVYGGSPLNGSNTYDKSQVSVSGGTLNLTVNSNDVSGAISTPGNTYEYGYYEALIDLPASSSGQIANWPAWWMSGSNWPNNGEIDIMEGLNGQVGSTYHNAQNANYGFNKMATGDYTGWHTYGVLWTPTELDFYYDGILQHTISQASGINLAQAPEAMILNMATGGAGLPGVTPSTMKVDYVHVYQSTQYDPTATAVTPEAGYGGPGAASTNDTGPTPPQTPDILTLRVSEDAYQGDARFTVSVDGKSVGGTLTASALHAAGDSDVFTLTGTWGQGLHDVKIQFLNDAYGGTASTDRNLYVDSIAYNGATYAGTSAVLMWTGAKDFSVGGTIAPTTAPADILTVHLAEDAWNGDAQFTLSVDGKTVTTPQVVIASHAAGAWTDLTFSGNFGSGSHNVGITFTNDAYGGTPSTDRNLYVNGVDFDGKHYGSSVTTLYSTGTTHIIV